jgi:hypothetical protein
MRTIDWMIQTIQTNGFKRICEVGVLNGELSEPIINVCHPEVYVMVERSVNDQLYEVVRNSDILGEYEITKRPLVLMRMESAKAAAMIRDGYFDIVHIDADHTYEDVKLDLEVWASKVRLGGMLTGHDYNKQGKYLVWKAVDERFGPLVETGPDDIWFVRYPNENNDINQLKEAPIQFITDFTEKKLVGYLHDGMCVLIRFGHGWGDTQMFMPIFYRLKELYPKVHLDLYLECGQEKIFDSYPNKEGGPEHDIIFSVNFPMAEGSSQTKVEKCCSDEIGIDPGLLEPHLFKPYPSPLVAVHFQGTALPNSVNCPPRAAQLIWNEIRDAGFIPIECHFEHVFHNPMNAKYEFIDCTVRGCKPELSSLIGLIQRCRAFVGVASGPLITALSVLSPDNVMYLERLHKIENYVKFPVPKVNVMDYKEGSVRAWLQSFQ